MVTKDKTQYESHNKTFNWFANVIVRLVKPFKAI